jgi:hypothetical protein
VRADEKLLSPAGAVVLTLTVYASVAIPTASPAPPLGALPPPPYPRCDGHTFEPSAAAFDPATGRVLVFSAKDTTLYRYELTAAGLVLPPGERHYPLRLPKGLHAAKLEGLTRLPSGAFLAVTAFDRPYPSFRRLLRFSNVPAAPVDAMPVALDDAALGAAVRAASGQPWFKIEALAVDRTATHLFFGVRNVGESEVAPRDVVLVVRCAFSEDGVGLPEAVIPFSTAEALHGLAEGLSDLQLDADGDSFLLLTSHEGTEKTRDAHSGHLFRVPASLLLGAAPPAPIPPPGPLARAAGQARGAGGGALRHPDRGLRRRRRVEAPLRGLRAVGRTLHRDRPEALMGPKAPLVGVRRPSSD